MGIRDCELEAKARDAKRGIAIYRDDIEGAEGTNLDDPAERAANRDELANRGSVFFVHWISFFCFELGVREPLQLRR